MKTRQIFIVLIIPLILGGLLYFLDSIFDGIHLWMLLIFIAPITIITNLTLLITDKVFKKKNARILAPFSVGLLSWACVALYLNRSDLFAKPLSIAEEISKEIDIYYENHGVYLQTSRSEKIIQMLPLNGNEIYPEYFSYHLDQSGKFYIIKTYLDETIYLTYDSRTKEELIMGSSP
ncbi:MAG: hypothetical protein ABFS35_09335 [Bacteroidota bacterium]